MSQRFPIPMNGIQPAKPVWNLTVRFYNKALCINDFKAQLAVHLRKYNNFPMWPLNWNSPKTTLFNFLCLGVTYHWQTNIVRKIRIPCRLQKTECVQTQGRYLFKWVPYAEISDIIEPWKNKWRCRCSLTNWRRPATKKKEFLAQIDRIIPWSEWIGMIQPHYHKGYIANSLSWLLLHTICRKWYR